MVFFKKGKISLSFLLEGVFVVIRILFLENIANSAL